MKFRERRKASLCSLSPPLRSKPHGSCWNINSARSLLVRSMSVRGRARARARQARKVYPALSDRHGRKTQNDCHGLKGLKGLHDAGLHGTQIIQSNRSSKFRASFPSRTEAPLERRNMTRGTFQDVRRDACRPPEANPSTDLALLRSGGTSARNFFDDF